jgi:hypothetical protein
MEITLVWLVLSCLKSELHQPQAEFISEWKKKKKKFNEGTSFHEKAGIVTNKEKNYTIWPH